MDEKKSEKIEPILKDCYQVVIVGAGIGGLACAAILAEAGFDVAVIEKSSRPGGRYSSFKSGLFTIDTAASFIQGLGEKGPRVVKLLFDYLQTPLEVIPLECAYRMYFGDVEVDFHLDHHAFTSEVASVFPQQAGNIHSLLRKLEQVYKVVVSFPEFPYKDKSSLGMIWKSAIHPLSAAHFRRATQSAVESLLDSHLGESSARNFFAADIAYTTGCPDSHLPVSHAAFSIIGRLVGGAHYPLGSSQHLANQLEKKVHKSGGAVAYHTPVKAIVTEDGHSKGVELFNGRTIRSNAVIYDGSLPELFGKLISPEALSEKTRAWVKSLKPTLSATSLYFGIPKSSLPEDIHPNTVLVEDPEKRPWKFTSMSIPTILDPGLAPDEYHSVFVHAVTENLPQTPWSSMSPEELAEVEESERARIFSSLNHFFPKIEKDAIGVGILPPSPLGGCLEVECDSMGAQTIGSFPTSSDEIKNLFLAGDSAHPGKGVAQEIASGIKCASAASKLLRGKGIHIHSRENYVIETVPVRPQVSSNQVVDMLSAVAEAENCLECEDAPCILGCPAHIDIPTFIRQLKSANGVGAALTIREAVCLGESNALVCPSKKLCEAHCRRKEMDRAIRIRDLEAVACLQQSPVGILKRRKVRKEAPPTSGKPKVAVIGAGPAGISCAHFLARMSYPVEVFESSDMAGGLPRGMMPSWLLDEQVLLRETEEALGGIPVHYNTSFGKDITFDSLEESGFEAVFLATGLVGQVMANTKGADIPGVIDALSFLAAAKREVKRELSPKTCVVGDGNIALDTARVAMELGAESVYVLSKKKRLNADPARVEKAKEMGISILAGREIEEIVGQGRVESVILLTKTRGAPTGEPNREQLETGTLIFADGRGLGKSLQNYIACHMELNRDGSIKVREETLETSRPGVFAGGDVRGKQNLLVRACADGRKGALSIDKYLKSRYPSAP